MNHPTITYGRNTTTCVVFDNDKNVNHDRFKIVIGDVNATDTVAISLSDFQKAINHYPEKEMLLVSAIRNLIRKMNFFELNEALNSEDITEDEFNSELKEHDQKYAITLENISSPYQTRIIAELMEKIGSDLKDFSTSEVSEMFSIKEDELIHSMNSFRYQLK